MNRITQVFKNKKPFIGFLTGGDPSVEKTEQFLLAIIEGGADIVEIGIPFSDPIAEGPTIQNANVRALKAGANIDALFEMAARLRAKTQVPVLFMTYLNPVFHYGYEAFFAACKRCGIDGIIIPDLPYEERSEVSDVAGKYAVDVITMIAPTSGQRVRLLAEQAQGFIYTVSSMGVTGARSNLDGSVGDMVAAVRRYAHVPVAVGFGISTPQQAGAVGQIADGVIVGTRLSAWLSNTAKMPPGRLRITSCACGRRWMREVSGQIKKRRRAALFM
jgi:tryptophan synthase alpha chain